MKRDDKTEFGNKGIRLDKWLKIARIYKTRTRAGRACEESHVKVNDIAAKPAKLIKAGDKITVKIGHYYRELEILDIAFKSIPAKEARGLYREERKEEVADESFEFLSLIKKANKSIPPKYRGRPTKKARRQLGKIRGF